MQTIMLLLITYLICFVTSIQAQDCLRDHRTVEKSWEKKLREDLFCGYKAYKIPTKNASDVLEIRAQLTLKNFRFDSQEQLLTIQTKYKLEWHDDFLTWYPPDYGGIEDILVKHFKIWLPNLDIINDEKPMYNKAYTLCKVYNTGIVICKPVMMHAFICRTQLFNWPYDSQTCVFSMGYQSDAVKITLNFFTPGLIVNGSEEGIGWELKDFTYTKKLHIDNKFNGTVLHYSLKFDRLAVGLTVLIIFPSILAAIITFTSLALNVKDLKRLSISCFSLIFHFYVLSSVGELLPRHGSDTPKIILFIRNSTALTMSVVLITLFLQHIRMRTISPSTYIVSFTNVMRNRMKYLIFTKWEPDLLFKDEVKERAVKEWNDFANTFNSISVTIFLFIYFMILYTQIPYT